MEQQLTIAVSALHRLIARFHGIDLRLDPGDDRGVEDSPAKMIWIAAAIIIAGLATAFAMGVFDSAKEVIPDPQAPTPGG